MVIDPETGQGEFSNAGHPPPLLISRDAPARVSTLEPGTPLGWPSQRQQTSFSIETGNTVVFIPMDLWRTVGVGWTPGWTSLSPWPRTPHLKW